MTRFSLINDKTSKAATVLHNFQTCERKDKMYFIKRQPNSKQRKPDWVALQTEETTTCDAASSFPRRLLTLAVRLFVREENRMRDLPPNWHSPLLLPCCHFYYLPPWSRLVFHHFYEHQVLLLGTVTTSTPGSLLFLLRMNFTFLSLHYNLYTSSTTVTWQLLHHLYYYVPFSLLNQGQVRIVQGCRQHSLRLEEDLSLLIWVLVGRVQVVCAPFGFWLCALRSRGWGCGQCLGCPECAECPECPEDRRTPRAKRRSTQSDHRHIDPVGHDEDGE